MSQRAGHLQVLVVWDRPRDFEDLLAGRFPNCNFEYAASVDGVRDALRRTNPEVVFSIKHDRFPTECHRIAAGYPGVKWVQVGGSGYEHLSPADLSGVRLTNAAGVLAPYLAETVIGAMLAWTGHLFRYREQQSAALWRQIPFTPLRDRTVLVVGAGAIGGCVAANAKSLGMRVMGANRSGAPVRHIDRMYRLDGVQEALGEADYISVHLRLNDDTHHFIDQRRLAAMKPGAFFINTSRGAVVDEGALLESLRSGRLSGAYLDVFEKEPLPASHPLWHMDNVLITPHAADCVVDWPRRFAGFFADNLERWVNGQSLMNEVHGDAAAGDTRFTGVEHSGSNADFTTGTPR
ncbi:MAG: D-2-hydroxyacid dehydrogenase [Arenicellales bacterium]